jgi:simple sugar transport system substrate-binding protein
MRARAFCAALVALLIGVLGTLAACGGSDDGGDKATDTANVSAGGGSGLHFAMVTEWDSGSFWAVVKRGAEQAAKDMDAKLTFSSANGDHEKQAQLIAAAVTSKVDGLAVSAADPDAIRAALQKATSAGIPVVTLNSGGEQSQSLGALSHVGQTETIAGEQAGQRLAQTGAKKLLCVNGESGNIGQVQRCDGAKQGFTAKGGEFEVTNVKGVNDLSTTLNEIQSKLQADPDIDAVLTLNPDIAISARDAIKGAGSKAKLGTFDLSGDVVKGIKSGEIQFAVDQQPYIQGYLPIVFLQLYATNADIVGGGQPVLTGPAFVDKSNVSKVEKLADQGTR